MLKIENFEVLGWEHAIRGMRNPMNSWEKSDSIFVEDGEYHDICGNSGPYNGTVTDTETFFEMGEKDYALMKNLRNAGTDHRKFMRMITVYLDITAPLYWWKEFDTYKVGTVANSCSTMHKIAAKEFTLEDFSCEHLIDEDDSDLIIGDVVPHTTLECVITALNFYRNKFLEAQKKHMKEESKRASLVKKYWWQMIQLLPTSYNQKRTVMLNYEVLANIYKSRRNHKLDEWHTLCDWIEELPYSELITGKEYEVEE